MRSAGVSVVNSPALPPGTRPWMPARMRVLMCASRAAASMDAPSGVKGVMRAFGSCQMRFAVWLEIGVHLHTGCRSAPWVPF